MSASGDLTVVIQAGGESRRMGRSKATVPFLGEPLLMRGVRRLLPIADELVVTTNEPDALGFLDDFIDRGSVHLATDVCDERGALRGILTALSAATLPYVSLVACDMLFPSTALIEEELAALEDSAYEDSAYEDSAYEDSAYEDSAYDTSAYVRPAPSAASASDPAPVLSAAADIAVPCTEHGYEPFHAVYRRDTCLPVVERAVARGEVKAGSFFDEMRLITFDTARVADIDPSGRTFVNVNTPDELAAWEHELS